jgi:hypothetical protein
MADCKRRFKQSRKSALLASRKSDGDATHPWIARTKRTLVKPDVLQGQNKPESNLGLQDDTDDFGKESSLCFSATRPKGAEYTKTR